MKKINVCWIDDGVTVVDKEFFCKNKKDKIKLYNIAALSFSIFNVSPNLKINDSALRLFGFCSKFSFFIFMSLVFVALSYDVIFKILLKNDIERKKISKDMMIFLLSLLSLILPLFLF